MDSWALFFVSSHFFHSSHLQGAGGYEMTRACFTWPHSVPSLWFPCKSWQEFLQSFLREVLGKTVGKQLPGCCWLCPCKYRKEYNSKSCCGFSASLRAEPWPQAYLWDDQWPGMALPLLASSWLLDPSIALVESLYLRYVLGFFTPALTLLESFLTEFYFIFLV